MQTKSRNGKFNISVTTRMNGFFEDDDNETIDVEVSPVKGEEPTSYDMIDTMLEAQNMVAFLEDL